MSVEKLKPDFSAGKIKHEQKPYTQILNKVLQECDNLEAIGLWCHFQSLPENWEINAQYIQNKFNICRGKAYKLFKYLIDSNLMEYHQKRNEDGSFGERVYIIKNGVDFKSIKEELSTEKSPRDVLPHTVLPHTVKTTTTNTNIYTNKTKATNELVEKAKDQKTKNNWFDKVKPLPMYEQKQVAKFWEAGNPDYDRVHSG